MMFDERETPSRETVRGDAEGVQYTCATPIGCGYEGHLVPVDWDTPDHARVTCPRCFEPGWVVVYE